MGRLRRVIPYLLFPSDPASAAMHCAPAGHAPRSVSAPMKSRAPAAAEAPRRVRSRGSHIDLADGLETGSPYFHLYSPGLALSRGGSLSCSSSPLSESAIICSSFSPRRFICFVPSGIMVILGSFMHFQAEAEQAGYSAIFLCKAEKGRSRPHRHISYSYV